MKKILALLFLAQFLAYCAFAQDAQEKKGIKKELAAPRPSVEDENYDISETIKKGRKVIQDQKEQLQVKEEPEEVKKEETLEEVKIEARRNVFEQLAVQEVEMARPTVTVEAELRREQYRQEVMATGGQEVKAVFKKRQFNVLARETYDDNIFLTRRSEKKKDYISKIASSGVFSMSSKHLRLDANAVVDVVRYRFQEKQSGINYLLFTDMRPGIVSLPFFKGRGGRFGLEVQNLFRPSITSVASNEDTARTKRLTNELLMMLDYYMSEKRTLALEYANNYEYFTLPEDRYRSFDENVISPKFYFHIKPKWSLIAGYDYGMKNYPKGESDSRYQRLKMGATGRFFTKLLSRFEFGREWRNYKKDDYGNVHAMYFKGSFVDKFTHYSQGSLVYEHSITDSDTIGYPYYIADQIDFDYQHTLTYKTKGLLGFTYIHSTYNREWTAGDTTKVRRDDQYELSLALRYYFKRQFYAEVGYDCNQRISNLKGYNYVENKFNVGANAQF